jgi:outer membrane protein assembly factor BamA
MRIAGIPARGLTVRRKKISRRVMEMIEGPEVRAALPIAVRTFALVAVGIISARSFLAVLRRVVVSLLGSGMLRVFLPLLATLGPTAFFPGGEARASERPLIVERIEIEGNTRTPEGTVLRYLGIRPGDATEPDSLLEAMEGLRASDLFRSVAYESRAGSERGRIVLHLTVEEKPVEFRFGAGYQDLSGWYLIPAELRFDNRLGRGEIARAHAKLGYRLAGVHLFYEEPRFGDGRNRWGASFFGTGGARVYFVEGVECRHNVTRAGLEAHIGREFFPGLAIEAGAGFETIEADSSAEAGEDDEIREIERGDELPFADLPAGIASDLGEAKRALLRVDLTWDSRSPLRVSGTPVSGFWGRLRATGTFSREQGDDFPSLHADLRAYRGVGSAALAARLRGGATGGSAPWYDRFYLGGLYTVRGFPSQSLSAPEGETRFWSASAELRAPLVGSAANPRLAGVFFVDAGDSWRVDEAVTLNDVSVGAGYGLRLRVPWIGWLGLDVARPLTDSPVREAFHGNASIGMTF